MKTINQISSMMVFLPDAAYSAEAVFAISKNELGFLFCGSDPDDTFRFDWESFEEGIEGVSINANNLDSVRSRANSRASLA